MTAHSPRNLPNLPEQFMPPAGWKDGSFAHDGRDIAYGCVMPPGKLRACAVILPGRAEFREKYFEVMRDLLSRDIGVYAMDWFGQGSSGRHLPDSHKDHSRGFEFHVADFNSFIRDIVMPDLHKTGQGDTPLVMLAHSMGAHIGLRHLMTLQPVFAGAVLSSPMFGIHNITDKPGWLLKGLTGALLPLHNFYAPMPWRGAWRDDECLPPGEGVLSSDPVRDTVQRAWFNANPRLQIGAPTWGWVHHALRSCGRIQESDVLPRLAVPILFITAGEETVVDNTATKRIAARIPGAKHADIAGARHEILMERDTCRSQFFEYFDNFLPDCKIT